MKRLSSFFLCFLLLAASALLAQQQPATPTTTAGGIKPLKAGYFNINGSLRVRTEAWDWFGGNAENTYGLTHSLFRLGIGQQFERADWQVELAAPLLLGVPDNAVAPGAQGAMGLGGNYYTANDKSQNAFAVFPKQAYLRLKKFGSDKSSLRLGRFEFVDGSETAPKDATLAALKRDHIAQRLIGNFGFSAVGRSYDGAQYVYNGKQNLTVVAVRPTRGVFQVDGLGSLDIGVVYGAWTLPFAGKKTNSELRVFAAEYDDVRNVVKTDNRPTAVRNADRADINIGTIGANYIEVINTGNGKFDVLMWGVGQFGTWGVQDHRAAAAVGEIGWQPASMKLKPWFRAGYSFGSGDGNSNDGRHTTFFQMLPTPRIYARFPFYNMQNTQDAYATVILRPTAKLSLRSELHAIRLADRNDLWYQGGGAFQPHSFGYTGRPSGGKQGLGNMWDISADYQINPHVGLTTYFANTWGKGVIENVYPKRDEGRFGYIEMNYRF